MIRKNNGGVSVRLSRKLYDDGAVKDGVKSFGKVCSVSLAQGKTHYVVSFSGLKPRELEEVALEFANYILSLVRAARISQAAR